MMGNREAVAGVVIVRMVVVVMAVVGMESRGAGRGESRRGSV